MTLLKATDFFTSTFENQIGQQSEALAPVKKAAFETFEKLGLPQHKSEAYKYTPIAKIITKTFGELGSEVANTWTKEACEASFYAVEEANHLVFIDGKFVVEFSTIKSDASSLAIETIGDAQANLLGSISNQSNDAFAQLNTALFENGVILTTKKNAETLPVFVYHFYNNETQQVAAFPRIFIQSETSAQLNVYEKTFTKGEQPVFVDFLLEADVKSNSDIRYTKLQQYDKALHTVEGIYAAQARDSRFYTNTYTFSGGVIRNNIVIDIDGENCEGHMNGLYLVSGQTHVDNNTAVDHKQANSYSNELYKGVLSENSRGVFNGKIYVRPDAQKTNAFQSNNNILLSETAIVNTKPQLEIWADDVKCSHGCTTGQLDEEAIFYLRARGISKTRAKALLLNAFAVETLEEVKSDIVKEEIETIILNKLG